MTSVELAWGIDGARSLAADCDVVVVVDVLSFTTCVSVATSCGAEVRPAAYDEAVRISPGELLAGPRDVGGVSLSPISLLALQPGQRLVLPSPNGAAIAARLNGAPAIAAALRNAGATAGWLSEHGGRIGVVAAGEYDGEGGWRPSYEDLVGAGAVIARVDSPRTPQAEAAARAFRAAGPDMATHLLNSRSGRELADSGFSDDVVMSAAVDADDVVPQLRDGVFVAGR
jgi:2-phosphosulfolactate phosphatase